MQTPAYVEIYKGSLKDKIESLTKDLPEEEKLAEQERLYEINKMLDGEVENIQNKTLNSEIEYIEKRYGISSTKQEKTENTGELEAA